jgi:ATP-dependent RNA helicase RhlE
MSFEKLGVIKPLLKAIADMGYVAPTNIQTRAIPLVLQKHDVFATAQTGTGKTAAFGLPMLQRLRKVDSSDRRVRGLILSPTRELAVQIGEDLEKYAANMEVKITLLISGKSIDVQRKVLKGGVDIVIATPGRFLEHVDSGMDIKHIEMFVLDEADRMLDMGFVKEIRRIHPLLPKRHQTLLFSATFSDKVRRLSKLILNKPAFVESSKRNSTVDSINQIAYMVDTDKKAALTAYLIGSRNYPQVLVFTRTKASADILLEELKKDGLKVGVIHGDKTKANRLKTLNQFRDGELKVLVATDIASRGLDIEDLPYVINYELPSVPEDYVHRVGRTGRAGRDGEAITLLDIYEKFDVRDIEQVIGMKIPKEEVKGFELSPDVRRKDVTEVKLKSEHKREVTKRFTAKRSFKKVNGKASKGSTTQKPTTKSAPKAAPASKKRKTTKRD